MTYANILSNWMGATLRTDAWTNGYTGFGTTRDKTTYTNIAGMFDLTDQALDYLYHGDDLAARIVDTVPEEMLRKGYCLQLGDESGDLETETKRELDKLNANEKLLEAMVWARTYGGSVMVLGADDGRPAATPLDATRADKLAFLEVIDRRYVQPMSYYSAGPKSGEPETYWLGNPGQVPRSPYVIHESRLLVFRGARTSVTVRQKHHGWDQSILQQPYEVLRAFATGFKAVETLLTDGPQGVYKIKGLASLLGSNKAAFEARVQAVEMFRSVMRAIVVDADGEGFERASFSFSGIPEVQDKLMLRVAAAARMPVTLLMGQSPAGMNATGESDFRWFYDTVSTRQVNELSPKLLRLLEVLFSTREGPTGGKVPDDIAITYEPLWTLSPKEEAERRLAVAQADKIYFDMGAITPEEVALSRFGDRGWEDGYEIDRDLREKLSDDAEERLTNAATAETVRDPQAPEAPSEDKGPAVRNGAQAARRGDPSVAKGPPGGRRPAT